MFERHKLLFSFNMTIKIEQAEGRAPQEELDFFLKGDTLTNIKDITKDAINRSSITCPSVSCREPLTREEYEEEAM